MERCSEHPNVVEKVEKVQVAVAEVKVMTVNIEKGLSLVVRELSTRKLTPAVTWLIGIMATIIGGMGMYILEHLTRN